MVKRLAYPPLLRMFDGALYVGQRSRAYYEHYGYPNDRLTFSPHCVDTEWFAARATAPARAELRKKLGIGAETKVVLFAGKLLPFKRPLDVIEAAAMCRSRGLKIEVIVAGDGMMRQAVMAEAAASNVPLHCLGFCNQTEMPAAYAAADCLVLPSESETWGLVANEALACGKPVIVSGACGCAPDLADGAAGISFTCGDVQALAAAMETMLKNPPSAQAIAALSASWTLQAAANGIRKAVDKVLPVKLSEAYPRVL